jgi:hypothetical protein
MSVQQSKILDRELSIAKANEIFMLANFQDDKTDQWGDWVIHHAAPCYRRAAPHCLGCGCAVTHARGAIIAGCVAAHMHGDRLLPVALQDWDMVEAEFFEALVRLCGARESAWADAADLSLKFELFVHDMIAHLIDVRCATHAC